MYFVGKELWRMHHHIPLVNISLPRVLPDLDGDLIPDLVASCAVTLPSGVRDDHLHIRNNFILISGRTGKVQGRPYLVEQCTDLSVLNVTSNLELQFNCEGLSGRKHLCYIVEVIVESKNFFSCME